MLDPVEISTVALPGALFGINLDIPIAGSENETGRVSQSDTSIGPAIVEVIYEYVVAADTREGADYVSTLVMYVFPQLEGYIGAS